MRRSASRLATVLALVLATLGAGAAEGVAQTAVRTTTPSPTVSATPRLERVAVNPRTIRRQVGQIQNCTVTGYFSDGTEKNFTQKVIYHSSNLDAVFPPNQEGNAGRVEAVGVGTAVISVTEPGTGITSDMSDESAVMEVVEAPTPTPTTTAPTPTRTFTPIPTPTATPVLVSLAISPLSPKRSVGQAQNFVVAGTYSDGNTKNLTQSVIYSSSNTTVAQTPNDDGNKGRVLAVGGGVATITATHASGVTTTNTGGDATFEVVIPPTPTATHTGPTPTRTVSPTPTATATPVLVSLALGPQSVKRGIGATQNFSATGTMSDGSTRNLTQRCQYTSSDPSVASAPNTEGSKSRVHAVGVGVATISAVDTVTGIGTTASGGNATFEVVIAPTPTPTNTGATPTRTRTPTPTPTSTPKLVSLVLAPTSVKRPAGQFQNFSVQAVYNDGSTKNFTQKVDYTSSNPSVAELGTDPSNKAKVLAKAPGVATISARDPATGITADESATFTVTEAPTPTPTHTGPTSTGPTATPTRTPSPTPSPTPILVQIELKPPTNQKPIGTPQFFTAIGTFSDGSTETVTQRVTYASSDPTVASAPNEPGNRSRVLTHRVGVVTISASDAATGVVSSTTGGDATLTVVEGSGSPNPRVTATPLPVQPGNPTTGCQRDLRRAARTYVDKKLKTLDRCGSAASRCVQKKPNDAACLDKVRVRCTTALTKLAAVEAKLIAGVIRRCAALNSDDVLGAEGLGYGAMASSCATRFDRTLTDLPSVAQCLAAQHACSAETLAALVRPRTGELLRLLGATPDAGACREDFGGSGLGVGDPKGAGQAIERCVQILVQGGASLTKTRLTAIGNCLDNVLACVEGHAGNAACLAKATTRCGRELTRVQQQIAKVTVAAGKRCNGLDFAQLRGPTGAHLDALIPDCEGFGVPDVASIGDYVACLVRRNACTVADLIRYESPRADALLDVVDRTLTGGPCP